MRVCSGVGRGYKVQRLGGGNRAGHNGVGAGEGSSQEVWRSAASHRGLGVPPQEPALLGGGGGGGGGG